MTKTEMLLQSVNAPAVNAVYDNAYVQVTRGDVVEDDATSLVLEQAETIQDTARQTA